MSEENGKGANQAGSDNNDNNGGSVSVEEFNALKETLEAQNKEIKNLRKEAGDKRVAKNEAEAKAQTLEQQVANFQQQLQETNSKLENTKIVAELSKAGCVDAELAAKAKPADTELSEWIPQLKKEKPYLFKQETPQKRNNFKPSNGTGGKTESFGDLFNAAFRGEE